MSIDPAIVGHIAGTLTTLCFIPQVLKVVRDKETKSISLIAFIIYAIGVSTWLYYGVLMDSLPIMIFNALTLILVAPIIYMKIKLG